MKSQNHGTLANHMVIAETRYHKRKLAIVHLPCNRSSSLIRFLVFCSRSSGLILKQILNEQYPAANTQVKVKPKKKAKNDRGQTVINQRSQAPPQTQDS
ncbi:hypothetical protein QL285_084267 [Trifolium repens]|nr:hypothetical protein QL285_084267 [Trifolium repens]